MRWQSVVDLSVNIAVLIFSRYAELYINTAFGDVIDFLRRNQFDVLFVSVKGEML